jgi:hypothetical protein
MKVQNILSEHKALSEVTAGEMLERQKGFAYELKKKGNKYYIYHLGKNKKAYHKGIKEVSELKSIVEPWLIATSLTYIDWSKKMKLRIVQMYIKKLKNTLED